MTHSGTFVRLGNVCEYERQIGVHGGLPYLGLEHIESGTGRFDLSPSNSDAKSQTFRFSSAHLLYGRLRPYLKKVALPESEGRCSTEIFPILPKTGMDRRYLAYWLLSDETTESINATCTGARMPRADMGAVLDLRIFAPALPEQHRIVGILDEAFAGIAAARANAEQNRKNAREVFQSRRESIFEKCRRDHVPSRLDSICENLDSRRIPITKSVRKEGEYPYYGASGIVDHVAEYIFDEDALLVSEDGANLLARSTPIAFSVSGKYWVNNHAHILKFDQMPTQRFVEFYIESINVAQYVTGAAQPKLNQAALNSIPIPLPVSLEEQSRVVAAIEVLGQETQHLESIYARKLAALDELKQSLLQQAFSGAL